MGGMESFEAIPSGQVRRKCLWSNAVGNAGKSILGVLAVVLVEDGH